MAKPGEEKKQREPTEDELTVLFIYRNPDIYTALLAMIERQCEVVQRRLLSLPPGTAAGEVEFYRGEACQMMGLRRLLERPKKVEQK